ncbi:hypothetical protein M378DRAFT_158685 [Amanita muscaria Koide BX008]|uniref:DNA replication factor Cdt1 C-terminal domain-containing protein n=1 Tax=Amanita muscaria (strain Koide BX008) TaxID=946122 RepID=A0A0C2XGU6_AMAMK|nr:hypothetical protein M378DRAFT_158685 [Amanita muscaria Koide BX008]
MSDIYSELQVSPKKKRRPVDADTETVLTPKKLRRAPPTPPATKSRRQIKKTTDAHLPEHLARLITIFTSLQHALSHALATCAVSPSQETGIVRNVLNHLSLATYGLAAHIDLDDLRRLCWVWEWDGQSLSDTKNQSKEDSEDENPFLDTPTTTAGTEWVRGAMGFVISPATHYLKTDKKRVPVYGIGIEVEMDIDKDLMGGMAAVARWTAAADKRRSEFSAKLKRWVGLHKEDPVIPNIPFAKLPSLPTSIKMSSLTHTLVSGSPKAPPLPSSLSFLLASPSKKSPSKQLTLNALPPVFAAKTPTKNSVVFPQTPSRRTEAVIPKTPLTPNTPSTATRLQQPRPATPVSQRGLGASTAPQTPTTSRRQAVYERVRQRSLSNSPTKARGLLSDGQGSMTRDQLLKFGQEETRRRCLLGRLNGVAESIWMLFSVPTGGASSSTPSRKRRALPATEVSFAVIKSSPVPISTADADDSIAMLTKLCPFFLRKLEIDGEDWLEMPAATCPGSDSSPTKRPIVPSSPGATRNRDSAEELARRSPRSVKKETGGLRQVRERIRREIEMQD